MHRRKFLWATAGGLTAASAAGIGLLTYQSRQQMRQGVQPVSRITWKEKVIGAIKDHFSYLQLDGNGLAAYVRDYESLMGKSQLYPHEDLYTRYLLSTDFFPNGADDSKTVRYVTLYDPHVATCHNPLARFPSV